MGFLRVILSLSVLIYHAGPLFGYKSINGLVAVHLFFIISGFYMALVVIHKYAKEEHAYYSFITNRFLRIYPTYWIVLLITIVVTFHSFSYYFFIRKPVGMLEDFTLLFRTDYLDIDMFRGKELIVAQAWTLVLELWFYLIAPFLVQWKKKYLFALFVGSFMVFYFITKAHYLKGDHYIQTFNVVSNLFFFIAGIFSYYLYIWLKKRKISIKYKSILCIIFLLLILSWNYLPDIQFRWILVKEWLMYALIVAIIPLQFTVFSSFRLDNFLGNLSYAIYISHSLAITLVYSILQYSNTYFSFWSLLITIFISILLVYLIEKPIDKIRQRRLNNK